MKILVIGASGLLARPVIRHMDKAGFSLRLFSRNVQPSMFEKEYETMQGNVFDLNDLSKAMDGCDAVHISLSAFNESVAVKGIVDIALQKNIQFISMVSGCSVSEENRWFSMIDEKYKAEQTLINSGIPYVIFKPTWFFESLELMVRNGKATILGNQPNPYHWLAADDFASMVTTAYSKPETWNSVCIAYGPKTYLMKELVEKYCKAFHPEIKKVGSVPIPVLKIIAFLTRNKELKFASELFAYFEKVGEPEIIKENHSQFGIPQTDFEKWLEEKKS